MPAPYDAEATLRIVTALPLLGRVVVVAGDVTTLGPAAAALHQAGAQVALVATAGSTYDDVTVHFRADPDDPRVWDRVAMHVEQHLGPVDAVVTDDVSAATVRAVLEEDMVRRGHGGVVVVAAGEPLGDVVSRIVDTQ